MIKEYLIQEVDHMSGYKEYLVRRADDLSEPVIAICRTKENAEIVLEALQTVNALDVLTDLFEGDKS